MNRDEFKKLGPGDLVKGRLSGKVYVVTANYGDRVTAATTADMTNPDEWELLRSVQHVQLSQ